MDHYASCDYWYCSECAVDPKVEETETTLTAICSADTDPDDRWLVQVLWSNEDQWESAKITSIKRNEGELGVVYLENEMEDTLDLNGSVTVQFVVNQRGKGNVLVCSGCFDSLHLFFFKSHR